MIFHERMDFSYMVQYFSARLGVGRTARLIDEVHRIKSASIVAAPAYVVRPELLLKAGAGLAAAAALADADGRWDELMEARDSLGIGPTEPELIPPWMAVHGLADVWWSRVVGRRGWQAVVTAETWEMIARESYEPGLGGWLEAVGPAVVGTVWLGETWSLTPRSVGVPDPWDGLVDDDIAGEGEPE